MKTQLQKYCIWEEDKGLCGPCSSESEARATEMSEVVDLEI